MSELIAVDVGSDFIAAVTARARERLARGDSLTVLFPNRRAVRFFEKELASPLLLKVTAAALEDFAKETVFALSPAPPTFQCDIDRFFTLHDIVLSHPALYQRLGGNAERVFPWCIHLSNLFDELDQNLIPSVAPLPYIDEVVPQAREILSSLDVLYGDYQRVMEEENLTYRGDIFRRLNALKDRLTGPFILAGFALLTEAQKSIFLHLFQRGDTTVFFHTDLMGRHPVSDPYRIYARWRDGTFWGIKPVEINGNTAQPATPSITFHESFDTHAEMKQLGRILQVPDKNAPPLDTGAILPDSQSLFPALYALPTDTSDTQDTQMNVTLGFPFERSVFFRLIDSLAELVLTRDPQKGFHHAALDRFLSHPFVPRLQIGGAPFEETARRLREEILSRNLSFVRLETLKASGSLPERDVRLCRRLNEEILSPFAAARTLKAAGGILVRLVHGFKDALIGDENAGMERQMVQNFLDRVLPNLTLSRHASRDLSSSRVLCTVLRHLVSPLHIPFEGNPLKGIQVMGMLESRLLNFNRLFILDVNEGILPRSAKIDPLLPPALNPLVGLPSWRMREALFRYHFFRLVDGSRESVHVFYQRGVTGDEKRVRSRFVEQLLLEEEMKRVKGAPDDSIEDLERSLVDTFTLRLPALVKPEVGRPDLYDKRLAACLSRQISPSLLDDYLTCPYRFYLGRIVGMPEVVGVQESQSAADVGAMVHEILDKAFSANRGAALTPILLKKIRETALARVTPAVRERFSSLSDFRIELLAHLTCYRLNVFFSEAEKESSRYHRLRVVETEKTFETNLDDYRIVGKADRIDAIEETPGAPVRWRILDYKTGKSAKTPNKKLGEFLASFDFSDYSLEALARLRAVLHSIQLPVYLYLFREAAVPKEAERVEAALCLLAAPPGEILRNPMSDEALAQDRIAALIRYLIGHMTFNPRIAPYDSKACPNCPYVTICRHTPGTKVKQA